MFALSRGGYYADFIAMPIALAALIGWQLSAGPIDGLWLGRAAAGLLAWTLAEYLTHRFVFHRVPLIRSAHDNHHARPAAYIGVSSIATLAIFGSILIGAVALFGASTARAGMVGFVLGYLAYIATHDLFHHAQFQRDHWLRSAQLRHAIHHTGVEANFGVISPLWDFVFLTYRKA